MNLWKKERRNRSLSWEELTHASVIIPQTFSTQLVKYLQCQSHEWSETRESTHGCQSFHVLSDHRIWYCEALRSTQELVLSRTRLRVPAALEPLRKDLRDVPLSPRADEEIPHFRKNDQLSWWQRMKWTKQMKILTLRLWTEMKNNEGRRKTSLFNRIISFRHVFEMRQSSICLDHRTQINVNA
jgi:hypothetical protein